MSGLLSRLAAQTLGKGGPAIHSLARIPYVASLELTEETLVPPILGLDAQPHDKLTTGPTVSSPLASDMRMVDRHGVSPTPESPTNAQADTSIDPIPTSGRSEHYKAAAAAISLEPTVTEVAVPLSANTSEQHEPQAASKSAGPRSNSGSEHWGHAPMLGKMTPAPLLPPLAEDAADTNSQEPHSAELATPEHVLAPEPLLNRLPSVRPQPPSSVPFNTIRAWENRNTDEPETTEVHVHIGRIEVTAVHEDPPQRTKPVEGRKPMSLDQYLARRKEEKG